MACRTNAAPTKINGTTMIKVTAKVLRIAAQRGADAPRDALLQSEKENDENAGPGERGQEWLEDQEDVIAEEGQDAIKEDVAYSFFGCGFVACGQVGSLPC